MSLDAETGIPIIKQARGYFSKYPVYAPVAGGSVTATIGTSNANYQMSGVSDVAKINSVISAISAAGGGSLYIKKNSYTPTDFFRLKSNVNIDCEPGTTFTFPAGKGFTALGQGNIVISNLKADFSSHASTDKAFQIGESSGVGANDIVLNNPQLLNCAGFGVFTSSSGTSTTQRVWVNGGHITGLGGNDLIGGGPLNSTGAVVAEIIVNGTVIEQDSTQGVHYTNAIDVVAATRLKFVNATVCGGVIFGSEQWPHVDSFMGGLTVRNPGTGYVSQVGFIIDASANVESHFLNLNGLIIKNGYIRLSNNSSTYCKNVIVTGINVDATGATNGLIAKNIDGLRVEGIVANATSDGVSLSGVKNGRYNLTVRDCGGVGFNVDSTCDSNDFSNSQVINCFSVGNFSGFNNSLVNVVGANPERKNSATVTGTKTVDVKDGTWQVFTLSGDTSFTFNNAKLAGIKMSVMFITNGFTVTLPSNVKVPGGSLSITGTTLLPLVWDTNWYCSGAPAVAVA